MVSKASPEALLESQRCSPSLGTSSSNSLGTIFIFFVLFINLQIQHTLSITQHHFLANSIQCKNCATSVNISKYKVDLNQFSRSIQQCQLFTLESHARQCRSTQAVFLITYTPSQLREYSTYSSLGINILYRVTCVMVAFLSSFHVVEVLPNLQVMNTDISTLKRQT